MAQHDLYNLDDRTLEAGDISEFYSASERSGCGRAVYPNQDEARHCCRYASKQIRRRRCPCFACFGYYYYYECVDLVKYREQNSCFFGGVDTGCTITTLDGVNTYKLKEKLRSGEYGQVWTANDGVVVAFINDRDLPVIFYDDLDLDEYHKNSCFIGAVDIGCTVTIPLLEEERKYELEKSLDKGTGTFGQVWRARDITAGTEVAIKLVNYMDDTLKDMLGLTKDFEDEAEVTERIHKLDKERTVKCIGNIKNSLPQPHLVSEAIVMDFYSVGDAYNHFKDLGESELKPKKLVSRQMVRKLTETVTTVAQTMVKEGLLPHDIKVDNVFIEDDKKSLKYRLGDHGYVIEKDNVGVILQNGIYYGTGATVSLLDLLQTNKFRHYTQLDALKFEEIFLESDIIYDINVTATKAITLLTGSEELKKICDYIDKWKMNKDIVTNYLLYEETISKLMEQHIDDKETFKDEDRKISMEELIIYIHWISTKQIEVGGDKYAITLKEYHNLLDRVDVESEINENKNLNTALYGR